MAVRTGPGRLTRSGVSPLRALSGDRAGFWALHCGFDDCAPATGLPPVCSVNYGPNTPAIPVCSAGQFTTAGLTLAV